MADRRRSSNPHHDHTEQQTESCWKMLSSFHPQLKGVHSQMASPIQYIEESKEAGLVPFGIETGAMPEPETVTTPQGLSFAEFTALVERHQRELLVFLCGMIAHREQARDLLQDTFCDAWRAARRGAAPLVAGGPPEEIRRWLFRTAYCRGIDLLRRRRLIRWVSLEERIAADDEALSSLVSFEDQLVEDETLRAALRTLAPRDVICLLLVLVQGFTAAEAAQIIGDSPQAIAKRLPRARSRLLDAYLAQNHSIQERQRS